MTSRTKFTVFKIRNDALVCTHNNPGITTQKEQLFVGYRKSETKELSIEVKFRLGKNPGDWEPGSQPTWHLAEGFCDLAERFWDLAEQF